MRNEYRMMIMLLYNGLNRPDQNEIFRVIDRKEKVNTTETESYYQLILHKALSAY